MIDHHYHFILEDFLAAHDGTSSDIWYVLRKMLIRGSNEASYRARISADDKATNYKLMMYRIEDVIDNLHFMTGKNGNIKSWHLWFIIEALKDCQCLLAIDQAETNADYDNLMTFLAPDLSEAEDEADIAA